MCIRDRKYHFDKSIYENRVFDSKGEADPDVEIKFGPNIKDWPAMSALPQNLVVKIVSEIHEMCIRDRGNSFRFCKYPKIIC